MRPILDPLHKAMLHRVVVNVIHMPGVTVAFTVKKYRPPAFDCGCRFSWRKEWLKSLVGVEV